MSAFYIMPNRPDEIYHFGIKRRSGRYPYGSGERPYQDKEIAKREKHIEIGRERLNNRIRRANALADIDNLSKKIGWENTKKAAEANKGIKEIKNVSNEILADENRLASLGEYTQKKRILDIALSSVGSTILTAGGGAAVIGLELPLGVMALPVTGAAALGYAGYKYYQKTKY